MIKRHQKIADEICKRLDEEGVKILRYDSPLGSIYLKFDYGVGYSLRISNHNVSNKRRKNKYRYHMRTDRHMIRPEYRKSPRLDNPSKYDYVKTYSPKVLDNLVEDILREISIKREIYASNYDVWMKENKAKRITKTDGFWFTAVEYN